MFRRKGKFIIYKNKDKKRFIIIDDISKYNDKLYRSIVIKPTVELNNYKFYILTNNKWLMTNEIEQFKEACCGIFGLGISKDEFDKAVTF